MLPPPLAPRPPTATRGGRPGTAHRPTSHPIASSARALACCGASPPASPPAVAITGRTQSGDDASLLRSGVRRCVSSTTGWGFEPAHSRTVREGSSLMTVCTPTTDGGGGGGECWTKWAGGGEEKGKLSVEEERGGGGRGGLKGGVGLTDRVMQRTQVVCHVERLGGTER